MLLGTLDEEQFKTYVQDLGKEGTCLTMIYGKRENSILLFGMNGYLYEIELPEDSPLIEANVGTTLEIERTSPDGDYKLTEQESLLGSYIPQDLRPG